MVTHCFDSVGMVGSSAYTHSCSLWVADSAATHASLPVSYSINNSYSQQIYLASELGTADTLTGITFLMTDSYQIDTTPEVVYLGNTSKTQFNSSTDYVAPSHLMQVFAGNMTSQGREVLRCSVGPSLPTTLSVNHLLSGVYFVRLADTPNGPVRKLIIQ